MYIVYKTINILNNKIYIGVHQTNNFHDDYLGSGELLNKAIKKYGVENFIRKIIKIFENKEDAYKLEKDIVNEEFILRKDSYNIRLGGFGGDGGSEVNKKVSITLTGKKRSREWIEDQQRKRVETMYKRYGKDAFCTFSGRNHKEKSKKKQSKNMKGRGLGQNNSQYGTCWIFSEDEKINKKIKKNDLNKWLELGWKKGRKMTFNI